MEDNNPQLEIELWNGKQGCELGSDLFCSLVTDNNGYDLFDEFDRKLAQKMGLKTFYGVKDPTEIYLRDSDKQLVAKAKMEPYECGCKYSLTGVTELGEYLNFGPNHHLCFTPYRMARLLKDIFKSEITEEDLALNLINMGCHIEKIESDLGMRIATSYKIILNANCVLYVVILLDDITGINIVSVLNFNEDFAHEIGIVEQGETDLKVNNENFYIFPQSYLGTIPFPLMQNF